MASLKIVKSDSDDRLTFRDLEADICDLVRAANIASKMVDGESEDDQELAVFAVTQFENLAQDLKRRYYEAFANSTSKR